MIMVGPLYNGKRLREKTTMCMIGKDSKFLWWQSVIEHRSWVSQTSYSFKWVIRNYGSHLFNSRQSHFVSRTVWLLGNLYLFHKLMHTDARYRYWLRYFQVYIYPPKSMLRGYFFSRALTQSSPLQSKLLTSLSPFRFQSLESQTICRCRASPKGSLKSSGRFLIGCKILQWKPCSCRRFSRWLSRPSDMPFECKSIPTYIRRPSSGLF